MSALTIRLRSAGLSLCDEAADALDGCAKNALAYIAQTDQDMARIAALEAQLAEARKDAERYRWLRQERYMFREGAAITCDEQSEQVALWVKCPIANDSQEVDAAIDEARGADNSSPKADT